jgi:hypothetical protein
MLEVLRDCLFLSAVVFAEEIHEGVCVGAGFAVQSLLEGGVSFEVLLFEGYAAHGCGVVNGSIYVSGSRGGRSMAGDDEEFIWKRWRCEESKARNVRG